MASCSYAVGLLATGALALGAARPAWRTIGLLGRDADDASTATVAEFDLRVCARLAAARRNLSGAAAWIGTRDPEMAAPAQRLALRAAKTLEAWYPDAPTAAADGSCTTHRRVNGETFLAFLHAERGAGPSGAALWPNWVVKFRLKAAPR